MKLDSDSVYRLGDKFGCDYVEAVDLLNEAAQLGMSVSQSVLHLLNLSLNSVEFP